MNCRLVCLCAMLFFMVNNAYAKITPFYFGADISHSIKNNSETVDSALGGQVVLGYNINNTWSTEISSGYYGNFYELENDNSITVDNKKYWGSDLSILGSFPISEKYEIYGGVGVHTLKKDIAPLIKSGINYQVDKDWSVNVGYKFRLSESDEQDLQILTVGVRYKLPTTNEYELDYTTYDESTIAKEPEDTSGIIVENNINECVERIKHYTIQEGDWLMKIARDNGSSLQDLIHINKNFPGVINLNLIYPGVVILVPQKCQ